MTRRRINKRKASAVTTIVLNKDDLLAKLEERRPIFEKLDKERLAKHQVEEKAHAAAFKKACQTAAKWSYDEAKKRKFVLPTFEEVTGEPHPNGRGWSRRWSDAPSCPLSELRKLDRVISSIRLSTQQRYTIKSDSGSAHSEAYRFLTFDPEAPAAALC